MEAGFFKRRAKTFFATIKRPLAAAWRRAVVYVFIHCVLTFDLLTLWMKYHPTDIAGLLHPAIFCYYQLPHPQPLLQPHPQPLQQRRISAIITIQRHLLSSKKSHKHPISGHPPSTLTGLSSGDAFLNGKILQPRKQPPFGNCPYL